MKLVLTCEHAGNEVPPACRELFRAAEAVLESHRGYDLGAVSLFRKLEKFSFYSKSHSISRLLVEVNRSLYHPDLFSEFTKDQPEGKKLEILQEYYIPYRSAVENKIADLVNKGEEVLHLSIHTFTPQLNGKIREADMGLLYDPQKKGEKEFCQIFKDHWKRESPGLKLRFNYPYLGTADGFTTYLRKRFPDHYLGIEVEVNQRYVDKNRMDPVLIKKFQKIMHRLGGESGGKKE